MRLNKVQLDNIRDLLSTLPSSSQNNERAYWRRKLESFYDKPSISKARELEDRFPDLSIDLSPDGSDQDVERGQREY